MVRDSPPSLEEEKQDSSQRTKRSPGRIAKAKKVHKCTYPGCGKQFARRDRLVAHEYLHTGLQPFKCTFPGCNKSFGEAHNLRMHARVHMDERPFVCTYDNCGQSFKTKGNLEDHIRRHEGNR